jgi:hypothetical protein
MMAVQSKEVPDLEVHVVDLTWVCLQQPVRQNPLFEEYFFDLDVLSETVSMIVRPKPMATSTYHQSPHSSVLCSETVLSALAP